MRRLLSLLLLLTVLAPLSAQKVLKPVREQLKAGKGAEALKLVEQLEKDSAAARLPRLYELGKQAQILINNAENEKIYLKQSYDTAKFFSSTIGIYDYILKCEQAEQRAQAEDGEKMKYHRDNAELLHQYYPNVNAGARYYYTKKNYTEAMRFFAAYLDTPALPIWGDDKSTTSQTTYTTNAYLFQRSAYLAKEYAAVPRYKAITLADTSVRRSNTLEYLSLAALAVGDTAAYTAYLETGFKDYHANPFFFSHLADFYANRQDYEKILTLADEQLRYDSLNVIALDAKSLALIDLKRYDEAIAAATTCLRADTAEVDAYYYAGAAYCYKAMDMAMPINVKSRAYQKAYAEQKAFYEQARHYLERYRQLAPDDKQKWIPLLYRTYFALNLGKQFEEIRKLAE